MPNFSKKFRKEAEAIERAYTNYQKYRKLDNERLIKYWSTRLKNLEEPLRLEANKRLETVLKQGIGESMGWYDKILSYIDKDNYVETPFGTEAKISGKKKVSAPQTVLEAYENAEAELQFLRLETSTTSGVRKVLRNINKTAYEEFGMTNKEFYQFWKWRQQNPVHEFFKLFPPSPPELRGSVGTMVVDLWNSEEMKKSMMEDYFAEYQRYLETQNDATPEGIPTSTLIKRLDELYESIGKRRRY